MDTIAYLCLAQANEAGVQPELSLLAPRVSQSAALGLLSAACVVGGVTAVADQASARPCYYPVYQPTYYPVYQPDYSYYYPDYSYYYPDYAYYPDYSTEDPYDYYYETGDATYTDEGLVGTNTTLYGDSGPFVSTLQATLADLGYYYGAIDGVYGPQTSDAVAAYQAAYGLTVDGVAGGQTLDSLGLAGYGA